MKPYPDVFVDLRSAIIRGSRNYHRLEHLGRGVGAANAPKYSLHEESVTDLLIGDLAGREYEVSSDCPACPPAVVVPCQHWSGATQSAIPGFNVRPLTKTEEGGGRRKSGVHADLVMTFKESTRPFAEVRLLIQAKRISPNNILLGGKREKDQYSKLVTAAASLGACPYYLLYVQQPDAHQTTPTRCTKLSDAADIAIVLVAAKETLAGAPALAGLRGRDAIGLGRPLLCLPGCRCFLSGRRRASGVFDSVLGFVNADFTEYTPSLSPETLPKDLVHFSMDDGRVKPQKRRASQARGHVQAPRRAGTSAHNAALVVIRLGKKKKPASGDDRDWIGWDSLMDPQQTKEATRKYWCMNLERAQEQRYVVAMSGRDVVEIYDIIEDSVIATGPHNGRRVEMDLEIVEAPAARNILAQRAERAVGRLTRGAQTPFLYA